MPDMGNPQKMARMMKQMGIDTQDVAAERVIIETPEDTIVVEPAQVTRISMQGQVSFQVSGKVRVEPSVNEDDVELVMEKARVERDEAIQALEHAEGDIAAAILKLQEGKEE